MTSYWLSEAGGVPHRRAASTRARAPAVPPLATQRAGSAAATSWTSGPPPPRPRPAPPCVRPASAGRGRRQPRHPSGADRQAAPPSEPLGTSERDLEAPAAEVEQQRRTLPERDARRHPREREAGLLAPVDEPHLGPDRALEQRRQCVAVGAVAEGARRERDDVIRPHAYREIHQASRGLGGASRDVVGDPAFAGEHPSEVQHDAVAQHGGERSLGIRVGDEQLEGGAAEVEHREPRVGGHG